MTSHSIRHGSDREVFVVYGALLVLLAATVGLAQVNFGWGNYWVAVCIASLKSLLILLYFMQVRRSRSLIGLFAFGTLLWLGILFGFIFADFTTRT